MPMTTETWRAAVAADRPPLTAAQLAALRPACQRMAEHMTPNAGNAAPAADRQEPRPDTERNAS